MCVEPRLQSQIYPVGVAHSALVCILEPYFPQVGWDMLHYLIDNNVQIHKPYMKDGDAQYLQME